MINNNGMITSMTTLKIIPTRVRYGLGFTFEIMNDEKVRVLEILNGQIGFKSCGNFRPLLFSNLYMQIQSSLGKANFL